MSYVIQQYFFSSTGISMNNAQKFFSIIAFVFTAQLSPSSASSCSASAASATTSATSSQSSSTTEKRNRDIFFKAVATFTVGKTSKKAEQVTFYTKHPLFESHMKPPYSEGNGGLLQPILKKFEVKRLPILEPLDGKNVAGVQIDISGCVAANGIAHYEFESTHIGEYYESDEAWNNDAGKSY